MDSICSSRSNAVHEHAEHTTPTGPEEPRHAGGQRARAQLGRGLQDTSYPARAGGAELCAELWAWRTSETPFASAGAHADGVSLQNVNKVNTKATVRCSVQSRWIPAWAREALKRSVCDLLVKDGVN